MGADPREKSLKLNCMESASDSLEVALDLPNYCLIDVKDDDPIDGKDGDLLALADDHLDGVDEEGVEEEGEEGCKSLREESDTLHSHGYTAKPWLHLKI